MNPSIIHITLATLQLLLTLWAWHLINKARVRPVEKVHAEPVDGPVRRKAPTYRQTQANALAYEMEAL